MTTPPDRRARTLQRVLLLGGLLLLSLNLRPAAVSVGPVLDELRDGLDMGPASAGLLTSLPVLAFAVFGALAPAAAARLGPHRVTFLALLGRGRRAGRPGGGATTRRRSWPSRWSPSRGWRWRTC